MFLVSSALRASFNRKFKKDPTVKHNNRAIILDAFFVKGLNGDVVDFGDEGIAEGQSLVIEAVAAISVDPDRALVVKYHPYFYQSGIVSGPTLITSDDGLTHLALRIETLVDGFDPRMANYLAKLYMVES